MSRIRRLVGRDSSRRAIGIVRQLLVTRATRLPLEGRTGTLRPEDGFRYESLEYTKVVMFEPSVIPVDP